MGEGVVVEGEREARGMELMTRSEGRGFWFCNRGGGGVVVVDVDGEGGDGGVCLLRASAAASSHAVRAEGSTGQVEGGGEDGACWTGVEDVLPIVACNCIYCLRINVWTQDGTSNRPKFLRGIEALGQN